MPRFFFHLITPTGRETDRIGGVYDNAECAWLEAQKAATEIVADTLRMGKSPAGYRFEVCDGVERLVHEIRFSELVERRIPPPPPSTDVLLTRLAASIQRTQDLQAELFEVMAETRRSLAITRALLDGDP